MLETMRQKYLEALGIVQYAKRERHIFSIGATSSRDVFKLDDPSTAQIAFSKGAGIESIDNKVIGNNENSSKTDLAPRFGIWQPIKGLLVCSELIGNDPGKRQLAILRNILFAMGVQVDELGNMEIIEWPRLNADRVDETEMREFFGTVIATRAELTETKRIIMFGDAAKYWFLNSEQIASIRLGRCEMSQRVLVALLPALEDMLEQPQVKREAWNVLRARACSGGDAFKVPAT